MSAKTDTIIERAVHEGVELAFSPEEIPSFLSSIKQYSELAETYYIHGETQPTIDELLAIIERAVACLILLDA